MRCYQAMVKLGSSGSSRQRVYVQANDMYHARLMLEALYGRGNFYDVAEAPRSAQDRC